MARPPSPLFEDRRAAGRVLASRLAGLAGRADVLVLALPRGGVPVAYEVAAALGAPLDVFLVRKLGVPGHEELAMGAIAGGGALVRNDDVIGALSIDDSIVEAVARREREELLRRELAYRQRPAEDPAGRTVVLVDDGLATGSSMRAAIAALRMLGPARIVVAVPVAPEGACEALAREVDDVVCAETPAPFIAVGQAYADFRQTTDDEVRELLAAAARSTGAAGSGQATGPARTPGS